MPTISKATERNWKRLNKDSQDKLSKRANKTQSARKIIANRYLNVKSVNSLLCALLIIEQPIENIMYSLVVSLFTNKGIIKKPHIREFLDKYSEYEYIDIPINSEVWNLQDDVLGFLYQSLTSEGERNTTGQYYTSKEVVEYMLNNKRLEDNETFLDPCCGSGAFLMGVSTRNPSNLYGFDINPIAVMIASANLLVKYASFKFTPQIYCLDFLEKNLFMKPLPNVPSKFNYIYTNPPWGSDKIGVYRSAFPMITSKERASMFIVEALNRLEESGNLYFLLPSSLLKIKMHGDIRKHILKNSAIRQIDLYNNRFDGVFTNFFSIKLVRGEVEQQTYLVTNGANQFAVTLSEADYKSGIIEFEPKNNYDISIIGKMESQCNDRLTHSQWALGIVTGDNKNKVKNEEGPGMEPIYTGKQVNPFLLCSNANFIRFAPESFQQCANPKFYRASEKLIYRFIARYPIVAYDNKQCLCLNSANVLIPELESISIKSTAALLNSSLYRFFYLKKFPDIKVLKGNLQKLPFPKLTRAQDKKLSDFVSSVMLDGYSAQKQDKLDRWVYSLFNISLQEQKHINQNLNNNKD